MMTNDNIGIDISKDFLDVHRLSDGGAARVPNTPPGFVLYRVGWVKIYQLVSCLKRLEHTIEVLKGRFQESFLW